MPNSATLLQTICAVICAILCGTSALGGGGMMIGANYAVDKVRFNLP